MQISIWQTDALTRDEYSELFEWCRSNGVIGYVRRDNYVRLDNDEYYYVDLYINDPQLDVYAKLRWGQVTKEKWNGEI